MELKVILSYSVLDQPRVYEILSGKKERGGMERGKILPDCPSSLPKFPISVSRKGRARYAKTQT